MGSRGFRGPIAFQTEYPAAQFAEVHAQDYLLSI